LETTFAIMPVPELRIEANAAFLHARFDNFRETVNGVLVTRDGRTPPNVPQQTLALWTTWTFMPGWRAQGGLRLAGSRYLQNANTGTTPAYGVVDASIGRRLAESTMLEVRAANIFDKLYFQTVSGSNTAPPSRGRLGAPRTIEVTLTTKF
jgi:iron complex outermembrane receptor protein